MINGGSFANQWISFIAFLVLGIGGLLYRAERRPALQARDTGEYPLPFGDVLLHRERADWPPRNRRIERPTCALLGAGRGVWFSDCRDARSATPELTLHSAAQHTSQMKDRVVLTRRERRVGAFT